MSKSIDLGPHRVQLPEWISCSPYERYLGMEILEAADGLAVLTMPFNYELAQGAGLMHGGALVSLADTAVVMAIKTILKPSTHFVTMSMQSRFVAPVKEGVVTAKAEVARQSDDMFTGSAILYNGGEREVLRFDSVFKVIRGARKK